ncbi:MAG: AEC family transporter, partial [Cetobacterium sp.]
SLSDNLIFPAVTVIIAYIIAYILVKILKIEPGRRGIFMNAIANTNVVSIGLPLNMAIFGADSMPYFLICYIVNTLSTWVFGVYLINNDDPTKIGQEKVSQGINWKKLIPAPMIGLIIGIVFLLLDIPVPHVAMSILSYLGGLVVPLSLIYVGTILATAGLGSIKFDRDTIVALIGRFIIVPIIMILVIVISEKVLGIDMLPVLKGTLVVQSGVPMLAVLPILATEANGDVKYATNVLVSSTVLFIVVIPVLMEVLQYI